MPGHNPTIAGGGFHHLAMRVANLDASIAFYSAGLGFAPKASWGEGDRRTTLLDTGDGNYLEISGGGSGVPTRRGAPSCTLPCAPPTATRPSRPRALPAPSSPSSPKT